MLTAVNDLTRFDLALLSGLTLSVWADGYSRFGTELVFGVLADVEPEDQEGLDITGRTPTNPRRVIVTVLRIAVAALADERWMDLTDNEQ